MSVLRGIFVFVTLLAASERALCAASNSTLIWSQATSYGVGYQFPGCLIQNANAVYVFGVTPSGASGYANWVFETRDVRTGTLLSAYSPSRVGYTFHHWAVDMDIDFAGDALYISYRNASTGNAAYVERRTLSNPAQIIWTRSFSSEMLRVKSHAGGVYVLLSRGSGVELQKLDAASGGGLWSRDLSAYSSGNLALDNSGVYFQGQVANNHIEFKKMSHATGADIWAVADAATGKTVFTNFIHIDSASGALFAGYTSWDNTSWDVFVQKRNPLNGARLWRTNAGVNRDGGPCRSLFVFPVVFGSQLYAGTSCALDADTPTAWWFLRELRASDGASVADYKLRRGTSVNEGYASIIPDGGGGMLLAGSFPAASASWLVERRTLGGSEIDIGLRAFDGIASLPIAIQPRGTLTSPLRISKNGISYGIILTDPSSPGASKLRVRDGQGRTKALKIFGR